MKVKSESEVAQSYPTLHDPMDYGLPGTSVHGVFQARVLGVGCYCLLLIPVYIASKPSCQDLLEILWTTKIS